MALHWLKLIGEPDLSALILQLRALFLTCEPDAQSSESALLILSALGLRLRCSGTGNRSES